MIIWGASIGPFESNPKAKFAFKKHLQSVDLITTREKSTALYLSNLGIHNNVIESADPAFVVNCYSGQLKSNDTNIVIGINLSPLSTRYIFQNDVDNSIKKQLSIIIDLVKKFNAKIKLIPHVVCYDNPLDDDLSYLKKVWLMIPDSIKNMVSVIEDDPGFIGIKRVLASCDIVLAARMHCAINALSLGLPTIMISYSEKSKRMADYVYGHTKWVISLTDIDKLVPLVRDLLAKKLLVRNHLQKKLILIKQDAEKPLEKLKTLIY